MRPGRQENAWPIENKIGHRWQERVWHREVRFESWKSGRTPAGGWLHLLVRFGICATSLGEEKFRRLVRGLSLTLQQPGR